MPVGNLLTAEEVGEMLGVDRGRVYQFAKAGRLPGEKTDYGWFFKPQDVRQFAKKPRKRGRPPNDEKKC